MKIIFVDDDEDILHQAKTFLEDIYGELDVHIESSAIDGLQKIEEEYYSAVVSDYRMPEMDGLEFLEELRDRDNDIPFIIFTGKGREEVAMRALNQGADGYIQKGGDPKAQYVLLAQTIKQVVERDQAEKEFQRSEKEKSAILNSLSEQVTHIDEDGRIIWANKEAAESLDSSIQDIIGEYCYDVWFGRNGPCDKCPVFDAYEDQERKEAIITSTEGRTWYLRGELIEDQEGEIIGLLEIKEDITEKREAKRAMKESEKKFRTLVETAPTPIFILRDRELIYLNRVTEELLGYQREELLSMDFIELSDPDQRELIRDRLEALKQGRDVPSRYELKLIRSDGDEVWVLVSSAKIDYEGDEAILVVAVDETTEKRLEKVISQPPQPS